MCPCRIQKFWQGPWKIIFFFLGYPNYFVIDCEGRVGGLALLWSRDVLLSAKFFAKNHIHVIVSPLHDLDNCWLFFGIYYHPEVRNKHQTWALMKNLAEDVTVPWLMCGDFNKILDANEKWGGSSRRDEHM